jgi:hypothetical protein
MLKWPMYFIAACYGGPGVALMLLGNIGGGILGIGVGLFCLWVTSLKGGRDGQGHV